MKNIQLPLKTEYFKMNESGEKTEDYRDITPYWCMRFFNKKFPCMSVAFWKGLMGKTVLADGVFKRIYSLSEDQIIYCKKEYGFKPFLYNRITLESPKRTDKSKLLIYAHAGIEIGTGCEEWGAEKGKVYFIIKHGKRINN